MAKRKTLLALCLIFVLVLSFYSILTAVHVTCSDIGCSEDRGCFADVVWHSGCDLFCVTGTTQVWINCGHKEI